jgi:hypothetical protein
MIALPVVTGAFVNTFQLLFFAGKRNDSNCATHGLASNRFLKTLPRSRLAASALEDNLS